MSIEKTYMAKVAMNKSVLKEYESTTANRVVYLNNGDEFQICLFNPETFTIGAEISINGEKENGLIIVRPGERVWIERPIGKHQKYKFETYEVEDSEEVSQAIRNNGEICVRFFKEQQPVCTTYREPIQYSMYASTSGTRGIFGSEVLLNDNTKSGPAIDSLLRLDNMNANSNITSKSSCYSSQLNAAASTAETASIETGRITSGSHSSQEFSRVNLDFSTWAFKTETIKILPMSRKPYSNSDLQKIYCTECGRKLNTKFKYCPYCGTKCI